MSKVASINLDIYQGATFRQGFVYKNRLKKPYNLTGFEARMQIRTSDGALVADLSTQNGAITLGGASGSIDLFIADEVTVGMNFTTAKYDLFLDAPNGDVIAIMAGKVTLVKGETKNG